MIESQMQLLSQSQVPPSEGPGHPTVSNWHPLFKVTSMGGIQPASPQLYREKASPALIRALSRRLTTDLPRVNFFRLTCLFFIRMVFPTKLEFFFRLVNTILWVYSATPYRVGFLVDLDFFTGSFFGRSTGMIIPMICGLNVSTCGTGCGLAVSAGCTIAGSPRRRCSAGCCCVTLILPSIFCACAS